MTHPYLKGSQILLYYYKYMMAIYL